MTKNITFAADEAVIEKAGCVRLLSEDMQHGQRVEELVIENPFRK